MVFFEDDIEEAGKVGRVCMWLPYWTKLHPSLCRHGMGKLFRRGEIRERAAHLHTLPPEWGRVQRRWRKMGLITSPRQRSRSIPCLSTRVLVGMWFPGEQRRNGEEETKWQIQWKLLLLLLRLVSIGYQFLCRHGGKKKKVSINKYSVNFKARPLWKPLQGRLWRQWRMKKPLTNVRKRSWSFVCQTETQCSATWWWIGSLRLMHHHVWAAH